MIRKMTEMTDGIAIIRDALKLTGESEPSLTGKTIIDVGCGPGLLTAELARQGANATSIDTPEIINITSFKHNAPNLSFLSGSGENLPVHPNDCADIMIYLASFHHIPILGSVEPRPPVGI